MQSGEAMLIDTEDKPDASKAQKLAKGLPFAISKVSNQ